MFLCAEWDIKLYSLIARYGSQCFFIQSDTARL